MATTAGQNGGIRLRRFRLLDRIVDRSEAGVERRADAIYGSHDHDAETGRNDAILNRCRAGLIAQKF